MTIIGEVDPVDVVAKLRKCWHTEMLSVGPTKESDKKEEKAEKTEEIKAYEAYYYNPNRTQYYIQSVHHAEEYPNGCVIC